METTATATVPKKLTQPHLWTSKAQRRHSEAAAKMSPPLRNGKGMPKPRFQRRKGPRVPNYSQEGSYSVGPYRHLFQALKNKLPPPPMSGDKKKRHTLAIVRCRAVSAPSRFALSRPPSHQITSKVFA